MASCKNDLKELAKKNLSDAQRTTVERMMTGLPQADQDWVGCLLVGGLKYKHNWYEKSWFGALVMMILLLAIFGGIWYTKYKK